MSLLMQALKKAERARQSGLQEEELADTAPETVADGASRPDDPAAQAGSPAAPPAHAPAPDPGGPLELSLEPLDDGPAPRPRAEPSPPPPPPPIQPAVEATHNPVPPQARHEGSRARPESSDIPVADARPAPRPGGAGNRRGPGEPERRAMPRAAARADNVSGVDVGRLRVAGLTGVLVIVAGVFGYLYWQGVSGPGPGASLPMVPMPPPSATGATNAGGDGGIVVAPAGPPFGPLVAPLPVEPAQPVPAATMQAPAQASAAAPAAAGETSRPPAYPSAPPPQRGSGTPSTGPTAAQLAAIEDPEIRLEAARDAAERMEREARMQANAAPALPPAGGSAPAAAPAQQAVAGVAGGDVQVARNAPASPSVSPAVRAGYATFGAGDLAAARRHYAAALRDDPNSRDALLGSAAVALRERRDDEAAGYYARLLAIDPRNAQAIAGLAALRPDDSERTEVRLKGVLRGTPDAAPIHFALGNLYARQGRWQDAQAAYFHAWSAAPANADYAFNLAVGLDRLNQGRLAREYYQRALALSAGGAASFDRAAAQRRLEELAPVAAPGVPAAGAAAPIPAVNPAAGN